MARPLVLVLLLGTLALGASLYWGGEAPSSAGLEGPGEIALSGGSGPGDAGPGLQAPDVDPDGYVGGTREGAATGTGPDGSSDEGATEVVLLLTVLDAAGEPLRRETLTVGLGVPDSLLGDVPDRTTRSDAEGRVRVELPVERHPRDGRVLRVARWVRDPLQGNGSHLAAELAIPGPYPAGTLDLGVLRLPDPERVSPLIEGVVLDTLGRPVPAATLHVEALSPERGTWMPGRRPQVACDRDGRFRIFGAPFPAGSELRLAARSGGFHRGLLPALPGTFHELRLAPVTTLVGRVAVQEPLASWLLGGRRLTVRVVREAQAGGEPPAIAPPGPGMLPIPAPLQAEVQVGFDGAFRVDGLAGGPHRVELALRNTPEPLFALPGLELPEGGVLCDPRLDPVDLAQDLQVAWVTLREPERRVVPGFYRVFDHEPTEAELAATRPSTTTLPLVASRAWVVGPAESRTLVVWPDGHPPRVFEDPVGEIRVELPARRPITLCVLGGDGGEAARARRAGRVVAHVPGTQLTPRGGLELDERLEVRIPAVAPGPLQLELELAGGTVLRTVQVPEAGLDRVEVVVGDAELSRTSEPRTDATSGDVLILDVGEVRVRPGGSR